jgi:copper resistance protein D
VPGWEIIAARFFQFGGVLVMFGASLFYSYGGGRESGAFGRRWDWPHVIVLIAAGIAIPAAIWWLMAQTASITGSPQDAFNISVLWSVLSGTKFGQVWALRLGVLVLSLVLLCVWPPSRFHWVFQAILGSAAVASLAWTGHGAMNDGWLGAIHLGSDVVHLWAAGIWLGALVPLTVLALRSYGNPSKQVIRTTHRELASFSGIGPAVIALLILTGLVNSWFTIGVSQWRALFTTDYGIALLIKLALFAGMLILAALNRFYLTPQLQDSIGQEQPSETTLRRLRTNMIFETALAVLVIAVVSLLGTLDPPISGS